MKEDPAYCRAYFSNTVSSFMKSHLVVRLRAPTPYFSCLSRNSLNPRKHATTVPSSILSRTWPLATPAGRGGGCNAVPTILVTLDGTLAHRAAASGVDGLSHSCAYVYVLKCTFSASGRRTRLCARTSICSGCARPAKRQVGGERSAPVRGNAEAARSRAAKH